MNENLTRREEKYLDQVAEGTTIGVSSIGEKLAGMGLVVRTSRTIDRSGYGTLDNTGREGWIECQAETAVYELTEAGRKLNDELNA